MTTHPNVWFVVGTRPEIIKARFVIEELRRINSINISVVFSGQHYDLGRMAIEEFGIKVDRCLSIGRTNGSLGRLYSSLIGSISHEIRSFSPDAIVALGDTSTVLAAAHASFYERIPFIHVEAGLRSGDFESPFPEEMHRVILGSLATFHICSSDDGRKSLVRSGVNKDKIRVVGNSGYDTLRNMVRSIEETGNVLLEKAVWRAFDDDRYLKVLVTMHRRESIPEGIEKICDGLLMIKEEARGKIRIVVPFHPNPAVHDIVKRKLGERSPEITLVASLPYRDLISAILISDVVVTDSAGIMEECAYLGKRVLVTRGQTERQELERRSKSIRRVGANARHLRNAIMSALSRLPELRRRKSRRLSDFFDRNFSELIAAEIEDFVLNRD